MLAIREPRNQTRLVMKTRPLLCLVLVVAGIACWFSACVSTEKASQDTTHNVVIREDSIWIPGTEISPADHAAMNKILMRYDKSLYRISSYENGQLKQTRGKLTDLVTDKTLASQIAVNVKKNGFTHDAMRIGTGGKETAVGGPSPTPGGTASPLSSQASPTPGGTASPLSSQASPTPGGTASPLRTQANSSLGGTANPLNAGRRDSEELVSRLKPILEKYSKK